MTSSLIKIRSQETAAPRVEARHAMARRVLLLLTACASIAASQAALARSVPDGPHSSSDTVQSSAPDDAVGKGPEFWLSKFKAAKAAKDLDGELVTTTTIARQWPARLAEIGDDDLFDIWLQAATLPDGRARRNAMAEAWDAAGWAPRNPFWAADYDWIRLFLIDGLLDNGRPERARLVVAKMTTDRNLLWIRLAHRYDGVRDAAPEGLDIANILQREEATYRRDLIDHPEFLQGPYALGNNLYDQGRLEEARVVLDEAIRRATPEDGSAGRFVDMDVLTWVYSRQAYVLYYQGRADEAVAVMKAGVESKGPGAEYLRLNLDAMYADLGQPQKALADMDPVTDKDMSASMRMDRERIRANAYAQLHREAEAKASLQYLQDHTEDGASWVMDALLQADRMEDAAKLAIKLLGAPDVQVAELARLQDYMVPDTAPPAEINRHARLAALRQRPDVMAALQAVGRVEKIPLIEVVPFK